MGPQRTTLNGGGAGWLEWGLAGDRIARLELFDEVEEWNLIMQHYSLAWASRGLPRPVELPAYAEAHSDQPFKYIN